MPNIKIQQAGPNKLFNPIGQLPAADLERWTDKTEGVSRVS